MSAEATETVLHVVPVGDLVEHDVDEDCMCGPAVEVVFAADGSDGWLVTHHSLDGRERHEQESESA